MTENNCLNLIKGLVLIGGIYSLQPLLTTSYNDPLKLTQEEVKTFSFNHVDTTRIIPINNIKVLVVVGECDAPKFVDESRNYAKVIILKIIHLLNDNEIIINQII